jgi:hypothetical protein
MASNTASQQPKGKDHERGNKPSHIPDGTKGVVLIYLVGQDDSRRATGFVWSLYRQGPDSHQWRG